MLVLMKWANAVALGLSAAVALDVAAVAQTPAPKPYPSRQIRMITPVPPGGISDFFARFVSAHLQEKWGQPVVVENLPGGGTRTGMSALARSAPDGYTLGLANIGSHSTSAALLPPDRMPYDAVKSFAPITIVADQANFLVVNPQKLPVNNVAELIAYAKANPNKITFATTGLGSSAHLAVELLMSKTGIKMKHVPYGGTAPGLTALLGGQVDMASTDPGTVRPHIASGSLRLLGNFAPTRTIIDPDVPTVSETVPDVSLRTWNGIMAPAGTPPEIIKQISDELRSYLASDEAKAALAKQGAWYADNSPEDFARRIVEEIAAWKKIGEEAGIKLE